MTTEESLLEVLFAIRPLQHSAAKVLSRAAGELPLPLRAVLEQLNVSGPLTVPQIGRSLLLPRQVVQRLADEGNKRGLIDFVTNPAHRRSRLLELSDDGKDELNRITQRELALLTPVARELSGNDVEVCAAVLKKLTAAMSDLAKQNDV